MTGKLHIRASQGEAINSEVFERARNRLKYDKPALQSVARDGQKSLMLVPGVPLLGKPGWIRDSPLPLDRVTLAWEEPRASEEEMRAALEPSMRFTRMYWEPVRESCDTYHRVISRIEAPNKKLFFNGSSYRLLDVASDDHGQDAIAASATLTFTAGRYFDALDTTDVLGYETALLTLGGHDEPRDPMSGPYRTWLHSPFDLRRRCAIPGVCTLTIRRGSPAPTFILHHRDPKRVALSQGVAHVSPAGEFQPEDLSAVATVAELDLWGSISREYAEEYLGAEHAHGTRLDDRNRALLRDTSAALDDARKSGSIAIRYLGVGLDPLTWKPEILTVAVFDADGFDAIFDNLVDENDEGQLIFAGDGSTRGIPFTEDNIRYWAQGRMLAAGEACLYLAWKHREDLALGG